MLLSALFRHPAASQLDQAHWNRKHTPAQPETALAVVQPPRRNVHGDPYMEVSSGVGDVYYAAEPPHWTKEPPTHPGVFWVRVDADSPRRVVEVYLRERELRFGWTDVPDAPVHGSGLIWSDRPIREPLG